MSHLQACRICLIMDVKMYDINSQPLNNYFIHVLGVNFSYSPPLPHYVCYECAATIKNFYKFKEKCLRGTENLYKILQLFNQITKSEIQEVDRERLKLSSKLSICPTPIENYIYLISLQNNIYEEPIKEESEDNQLEFHLDIVKEESIEDHYDDPDLIDTSDDEPLSVHKQSMQEKRNGVVSKNVTESVVEDISQEIKNVACTFEECEPPEKVIKSKRGRKRRLTSESAGVTEKKKRGPKARNLTRDEMILEDFVIITKLTPEEQQAEILARKTSTNYLNSPYKCPHCYKGFVESHAYDHHMKKHNPMSGDVECEVCKFRFKTRRHLLKHAVNHEKKYSCVSCSYVSTTSTQAKEHQKWHKGITYKCKHCDEISTKWTSHLSHVRIKHPSQFICGICGYSFVSKLGMTMHKTMMHKDVVENTEQATESAGGPYCDECSVQFTSVEAYNRHMVTSANHYKANGYSNGCRVCGATFENSEELRIHHRKLHARQRPRNYGKKPPDNDWPATCAHCPEIIENAREQWAHFRRAHPDKKYPINKSHICEICGKGFRANAFLVYHRRTHYSERNYKCAQCPKAFFNRTNLQMHEKTHSDVRPHACSVCHKAFKSKGALTRHFRSHTGAKPYTCEFCSKGFSQSNSKKLHIRTVHLRQPAPYISKARLDRRRQQEGNHTAEHFAFLTEKL